MWINCAGRHFASQTDYCQCKYFCTGCDFISHSIYFVTYDFLIQQKGPSGSLLFFCVLIVESVSIFGSNIRVVLGKNLKAILTKWIKRNINE